MATPLLSTPGKRRDHLQVVDEHAAIPVVFVCASADVEELDAAVRSLGDTASTLGGLELDAECLRRAAQLAERQTLFVLCKTDALAPEAVRRAVESFGARSAANHRLLVIELVPHRAASCFATVRRARAQLGRAREGSAGARVGMRDSAVVESVGGETHVDHALARLEIAAAAQANAEAKTSARDHVGPIPPHVRMPISSGRKLAVVSAADRDTLDDHSTESDAELIAPLAELRPPAATASPPARVRFDRATIRIIMVLAAAVAASAVVMFGR